jgi:osmotically-inducible protein OsmY
MKPDHAVRTDVDTELDFDPAVDNREIVVTVWSGVVTLRGNVPAYADKWGAERAAKCVDGVRAIVNEIDVKPAEPCSDLEIAAAALAALEANALVPVTITVTVRNGWVTLEGRATRWHPKNAAEQVVRTLKGVRGVSNQIEIQGDPLVDAREIRNTICAAFARHADVDADRVIVSVIGDAVTLSGVVRSWHEREEAEVAAWAAPGVRRVNNELVLTR